MQTAFLSAGLACLIAAVVGGGLKAFGIEVPLIPSTRRQILTGVLGIILIGVALVLQPDASDPQAAPQIDRASLLEERAMNIDEIDGLNRESIDRTGNVAEIRVLIAQQRDRIVLQEGRLNAGEGSAQERAEAREAIDKAQDQIVRSEVVIAKAERQQKIDDARVSSLEERNRVIWTLLAQ